MIESSGEIAILQALAAEVRSKIPVDPLDKLKRALAKAIAEERYEDAAGLRDQIHKAEQKEPNPDGESSGTKNSSDDVQ